MFQRSIDALASDYFAQPDGLAVDFTAPAGAEALLPYDSVSWRIMKNPVALIVGGIAAVILELAEPHVRQGVWERTSFRSNPLARMKRTGYAAMATIYAPAEEASALIEKVNAMHAKITGALPDGRTYAADDPKLLRWVYATAAYGFGEAYRRYVRPLPAPTLDAFYAEGQTVGALYGVVDPPTSSAAMESYIADMRPNLQQSDVIFEFIEILREAHILPWRALQHLLIRAAVELTPTPIRDLLELGPAYGLQPFMPSIVKACGRAADEILVESAPPAQACRRLSLPADYLYRPIPASAFR